MNQELIELAKQLTENEAAGTLSTHSVKHAGYPFASSAPFCVAPNGSPVFLLSSLAAHTKNLKQNSKASLLVAASKQVSDARLTVIGDLEKISESERDAIGNSYLQRHPEAQQWVSFGDFAFYRLVPIDLYLVAGFGKMGWIKPDDYAKAF